MKDPCRGQYRQIWQRGHRRLEAAVRSAASFFFRKVTWKANRTSRSFRRSRLCFAAKLFRSRCFRYPSSSSCLLCIERRIRGLFPRRLPPFLSDIARIASLSNAWYSTSSERDSTSYSSGECDGDSVVVEYQLAAGDICGTQIWAGGT